MKIKDKLHNLFLEKSDEIESWFSEKIKSKDYPFYCSFDIRESDYKIAPVDANMFPAGFNNICQADRDVMGELLDKCMNFKNLNFRSIGIFCENHTKNPYYWDNVNALKELFLSQDKEVFLFTPSLKPKDFKSEEPDLKELKFGLEPDLKELKSEEPDLKELKPEEPDLKELKPEEPDLEEFKLGLEPDLKELKSEEPDLEEFKFGLEPELKELKELKPEELELESASGHKLKISTPTLKEGFVYVENTKIDFILINNDLSSDYDSWIAEVGTLMLPPLYMGWNNREKQSFFDHYNKVVREFSEAMGIESMHLTVETETYKNLKIEDKESLKRLKETAEHMNDRLIEQYKAQGFNGKPYLFVKNNHGTYGLGVIEVQKPKDILNWNYKSRKKMKASKGGKSVKGVIIQEGIPTTLMSQNAPTEAVIYLLGCGLAGGFLRTNQRKDSYDNLNAPGAIFQRMCFSDYEFQKEDRTLENVYGTIARLGALALSLEMKGAQKKF